MNIYDLIRFESEIKRSSYDSEIARLFKQYDNSEKSKEIEDIITNLNSWGFQTDSCSGVCQLLSGYSQSWLLPISTGMYPYLVVSNFQELKSKFPKDNDLHIIFLQSPSNNSDTHNVCVVKKGYKWAIYQGWAGEFHLFPQKNEIINPDMLIDVRDSFGKIIKGFIEIEKSNKTVIVHNEYHHNLWISDHYEYNGSKSMDKEELIETMLFKEPYLTKSRYKNSSFNGNINSLPRMPKYWEIFASSIKGLVNVN